MEARVLLGRISIPLANGSILKGFAVTYGEPFFHGLAKTPLLLAASNGGFIPCCSALDASRWRPINRDLPSGDPGANAFGSRTGTTELMIDSMGEEFSNIDHHS